MTFPPCLLRVRCRVVPSYRLRRCRTELSDHVWHRITGSSFLLSGLDELTIEDYIAGVFGMAQRLPGTG